MTKIEWRAAKERQRHGVYDWELIVQDLPATLGMLERSMECHAVLDNRPAHSPPEITSALAERSHLLREWAGFAGKRPPE